MADRDAPADAEELQFDRVVTDATDPTNTSTPAVVCAGCQTSISTEYYQINGTPCCGVCRGAVESVAETPRGIAPLLVAGAFGLGAGLVGAAIYYAVIAITNFEIGIVAILIGYMVGYAVRRGARGRGGLRFQILAVALTYLSVAFAYTPLAVQAAIKSDRAARESRASGQTGPAAAASDEGSRQGVGRFVLGIGVIVTAILTLPVWIIVGTLPSGLISALIIFFGMRQAWRMTGVPRLEIYGPYRVGAEPASATV